MSVHYAHNVARVAALARGRLEGVALPLTVEELKTTKDAMHKLAAVLVGCTVPELLIEGGSCLGRRMGSTCCNILQHILQTCRELQATLRNANSAQPCSQPRTWART